MENDDCHTVKCDTLYKSKSPNVIMMILIAVSTICLLGLILVLFMRYCRRRQQQEQEQQPQEQQPQEQPPEDELVDEEQRGPMTVVEHYIWNIHTEGLPQSVIDSIAIVKYTRHDSRIQGTKCLVCLMEFEEEEDVRIMPECCHPFHMKCIDAWLLTHKNCPSCRTPIGSENATPSEEEVAESSNRAEMRLSLQQQESPNIGDRSDTSRSL